MIMMMPCWLGESLRLGLAPSLLAQLPSLVGDAERPWSQWRITSCAAESVEYAIGLHGTGSFRRAMPESRCVYGFGILDLKETAVVLQVPDFGNRFWLFQLGDHRTESFAQIGSMYDTRPGHYLIVGSDWDGVVPNGIEGVLRSSTNLGFCLPRIYMVEATKIVNRFKR